MSTIELLDDLRRLVADSDKAGEGWASDVCGKAIAEIEQLIMERDEREAAAVSLARAEFPLVECLRRWPWLKEE